MTMRGRTKQRHASERLLGACVVELLGGRPTHEQHRLVRELTVRAVLAGGHAQRHRHAHHLAVVDELVDDGLVAVGAQRLDNALVSGVLSGCTAAAGAGSGPVRRARHPAGRSRR